MQNEADANNIPTEPRLVTKITRAGHTPISAGMMETTVTTQHLSTLKRSVTARLKSVILATRSRDQENQH
jgi:hypothetical protein